MAKFRFRPEDFGGLAREFWFPEMLEIANAVLEAEEMKCSKVFSIEKEIWETEQNKFLCEGAPDEYSALLWNAEEIKK